MNDKTEQALTDALRLAAKSAAPYGTAMIGASHLNEAADTIDTLRAQLAEAQRDAARWVFFRHASLLRVDNDHPLSAFAERLIQGNASADDVDAAIDAAMGETR